MYDAFGVDDNLYVVWLDVVQPMGFDHFKAFIQHGAESMVIFAPSSNWGAATLVWL